MDRKSKRRLYGVIKEDLKVMKSIGIDDLRRMDKHYYFMRKQQQNPERYEGLVFNGNGRAPHSEDLEKIFEMLISKRVLDSFGDICIKV